MNIAFIGEAGSGKDILADYLSNSYGFTRYAFADEVRTVAKKYFPDLYGIESKKNRELLQKVGTYFREIDPKVWINALFKEIDKEAEARIRHKFLPEFIVITDCRMPNEYEELRARGFVFIRINVDEDVRKERLKSRGDVFSDDNLKHVTESHYNEFFAHYEVDNNDSINKTYAELDKIIEAHLKVEEVGYYVSLISG